MNVMSNLQKSMFPEIDFYYISGKVLKAFSPKKKHFVRRQRTIRRQDVLERIPNYQYLSLCVSADGSWKGGVAAEIGNGQFSLAMPYTPVYNDSTYTSHLFQKSHDMA